MTNAQLTTLLEQLAQEAGAASFWHGKQSQADINYNAAFPQAHLFLMPSRLKGDTISTQVAMCFYGADQHENGSQESIAIQDEMDQLTQRFYQLIAASEDLMLADDAMDRVPVLRKGSAIGTGYLVNFTLLHLVAC